MEIITRRSEKFALEMYGVTLQRPDAWMAMTVQLAPLHREMIEHEGLSRETIAKMRRISALLAASLKGMGLDHFNGKVFAFQDGDLLAFYEKEPTLEDDMMRELRKDNNLIQFITVEPLTKCRQDMARYIRTKSDTAAEYQQHEKLLAMADNLHEWVKPEHAITETLRKKRRMRKASCILVIEDDPLVRDLLTNMLKDQHRVISKPDAKSGILSYAYYAPNIVFLDIHMPGLNGHETLTRIIDLDADAYVVMISGLSSQDNVLATYSNGAAGFLAKPFSREKLRNYIRDCPSLTGKMRVQAG
jgi:CheY-like chemotaxis protein